MKKLLTLAVIFLLLGLCNIPSYTGSTIKQSISHAVFNGNTLYVGGSGPNNYTKIQDAINDSSDGDIVFVYDDSSPYYENLIIDKSIDLIGEDKNNTYIIDNYSQLSSGITIDAEDVTLSGFSINCDEAHRCMEINQENTKIHQNNFVSPDSTGIQINSDYNQISNNIIDVGKFYCIEIASSSYNIITKNNIFTNSTGIGIHGSSNNIVNENIIVAKNNFCRGIILTESSSVPSVNRIENNSLFDAGIFIRDSWQNHIINNQVNNKPLIYLIKEENKILDEDAGQIFLVNCHNITIQNQNISTATVGIILKNSNKCTIEDNRIISCHLYGIQVETSHNIKITNNRIESSMDGVYIHLSVSCKIFTNIITMCADGVWVEASSMTNIYNNQFYQNGFGVQIYLSGFFNKVFRNNFISNAYSTVFVNFLGSANIWFRNYYFNNTYDSGEQPGFLLKPIDGYIALFRLSPVPIPSKKYDLLPAQEPYDIP